MSRADESIERVITLMVARSWGKGSIRYRYGVSLEDDKNVLEFDRPAE